MNKATILFDEVSNYIDLAEENGEIQKGILEPLEKLVEVFANLEKHWIREVPESQLQDSFAMYHVARNCGLILSRMIERFREAPLVNDNPKVAEDSSVVIPILIDSYFIMEQEINTPSTKSSLAGFSSARKLRKIARMVDLIPSQENEERNIPKENREKGFTSFAEIVAGIVGEE